MNNMMEEKTLETMSNIHARNEELARAINMRLTAAKAFCANVMGAPGAGKTTVISSLIGALDFPSYVIEGDIASDIDTRRLKEQGVKVAQINTGGACHLDSTMIGHILDEFSVSEGFLFIENIGNLVCPAEFMIGEHVKLLVCSVCEGDDKPFKYPLAFEKADAVVLNKIDLLPHVDFDEGYFLKGLRALNPDAPVFRMSIKEGAAGASEAVEWVMKRKRSAIA
jgi:hydrogenase nickel incorporation protein HypB